MSFMTIAQKYGLQVSLTNSIFDNDKQGYIFASQLIRTLKNQQIENEQEKIIDLNSLMSLTDHYYQVELSNKKDWNDELRDN